MVRVRARTADGVLLRGRRVDHRAPDGIPGLFRDQRRRTPDAVACSDPYRSLTYLELDQLSDELAATILRATGGCRGAVALCMHRQVGMLTALLGILKAGCHYVPVATDEPASRVRVMMDVVRPVCGVAGEGLELALDGVPVLPVPQVAHGRRRPRPLPAVAPEDPVYAMFTSGSTGTPKAVQVGSAGLSNRILWMAREFGFTAADRVLQKTPYTFDVAGWEFYVPLVSGARCVFAPPDAHHDARRIEQVITAEGITACHFVPSMLEVYLRLARVEANTSLRMVVCSGEALPAGLAARFVRRCGAELHNLYGPTEAAIDVTHWPVPRAITPEDAVPIGAPIDNVDLCVVDAEGNAVPDGEVGELWIGGVQVGLGYVGRPELTGRAFVVADGRRWYRTGDQVRIEDGQVHYLGRIDDQVKIRGVRIEPGEVEAVLQSHPAIARAVVVPVAPPDGEALDLVAVAVPAGAPAADTAQEVLGYAGTRLPRAFVPRILFWADDLPLTSSGKADRRRVRADAERRWAAAVAAAAHPDDPVAQQWWRILGTPADQRRADAGFVNLGGHSLTATRLLAAVAAAGHGEVPLSALLRDNVSLDRFRTLLSEPAERPAAPAATAGAAGTSRARSPLAPAQEPLWLLSRVLPDPSGYNVVGSLRVPADVDDAILLAAVRDVVARHDALRAWTTLTDGVPSWVYADRAEVRLRSVTAPGELTDDVVTRFAAELAGTTIPTEQPPLMNVGVLHGTRAAVLTVVLHHIIADQRTLEIVVGDLATAYAARSAGSAPQWPADAPSFADYAHEHAATVGTPRWHEDLAYWERLLHDAPARTPLPFRLDGPDDPTLTGRPTVVDLGPRLTRDIDALLAERGYTTATYFLACVAAVLAAWSGEPVVTVGMPMSRRARPAEFDLVGHVLGTVSLRLSAGDLPDPDALLAHVRDRQVEALEHATPSFQAIVRRLGLPPSLRDNPLFQVWLNDLTRVEPAPRLAGAAAHWIDVAPPAALFDLNFYLRRDDTYRLELVCGVGRYEDPVVEDMLRQVVAVAAAFAGGQRAPGGDDRPRAGAVATPAGVAATPADLVAAVRDVARWRPDGVALGHGGTSWTFAELMRRVDRVAEAVAAAGIGPGDVLQLLASRTVALPVALLGAWSAGAAVAVTDAAEPASVLAEAAAVLRPKAVMTLLPTDPLVDLAAGHPAPRRLDGISHVLFTSGSSGRPAAVAVPPGAVAATLRWYVDSFELGPADRVAMLGGVGHDPLLRDILAPLLAGGTVVVPPEGIFTAPDALFGLLHEHRVTVLNATPALLEMVLSGRPGRADAELDRLRLVVSGGAPLTAGLVRALRTVTPARVVNAYGTTETPQIASCQEVAAYGGPVLGGAAVPDAAVLPVGAGVGGAELAVVRADGAPAPVGQVGEVVVRSPYLAAGYLDGSGRTGGFDPERGAYRTGDRGRFDPAGAVVLDGRLDRQFSIDGHRLDPEQVERAALRHPGIRQALARLRPTPAGPVLSLSVVPVPGTAVPSAAELRSHLRAYLPRYAVPTEITVAGEVITDHHHKVVGVRAPVSDSAPTEAGASPDAALDELAGLVREVVGAQVARTENFFDAGLTSMAMVRLHAALCERLAVDIPVTAMFAHPNLTALARFIANGSRDRAPIPVPELAAGAPDGDRAERRRQLRQRIRGDFGR